MELQEAAAQILRMARETREHMWAHHKQSEINTQLSVLRQGKEEWDTVPDPVMVWAFNLYDDIESVIREVLKIPHEWESWNGYKQVVFVTDGYGQNVGDLETTALKEDTDLEEDYKYNPHSDVTRVCFVCIAQDDLVGGAESILAFQQWGVDDGGVITYGEPTVKLDVASDPIVGALVEAINDRP